MALIDKASLLMVPSTYEAGKLYNVLPSGNRAPDSTGENSGYDQTRADFDFDRGSNAAATRVNADGLIEKYRENKLLQSNQFDTSWPTTRITLTSGHIGYDGSSDAWELESTATSGQSSNILQNVSLSGVQTFSLYAKAGTASWFRILGDAATDYIAFFDLSGSGSVGTTSGEIEAKIVSVGSGWFRCSITANADITRVILNMAAGDNDVFPSTGDTIYIQNAQLESGMVSTDYLESTSVTGKAGVLIDLPRIDYSSGAGALLLEPQRANLVQFSEVFNIDTSFIPSGRPAVETNATTSPEGLQNASRLTYGVGNSLRNGPEFTFTNAYTYSIFVKKDVGRYVTIYAAFFTTSAAIGFDLDEGTCQAGGVIEPYGDGWYRVSVSKSVSGDADKSGYFYLYSTDSLGSTTSTNGNKLFVWGNQIEEGSYVSSYIPNHGESGGVTRAADSCSVTGASDVIGQTEGTLYFEADIDDIANAGGYSGVLLSDGTSSNQIYITFYDTGRVQAVSIVSGSIVVNISDANYGLTAGTHKFAVAYKANDYVFYIDGSSVGSDTTATVPATNKVDLFFTSLGSLKYKEATLFNERLSNAELATLTTL